MQNTSQFHINYEKITLILLKNKNVIIYEQSKFSRKIIIVKENKFHISRYYCCSKQCIASCRL